MSDLPPNPSNSPPVDRRRIHEFRRQHVLVLLGLILITNGVYSAFWFARHTRTVNRIITGERISGLWIVTAMTMAFLTFGLDAETFFNDRISSLIGLCTNILCTNILLLVLAFKVRNRLNWLLRVRPGDDLWVSGLWTFLFGALYLQYRINNLQRAYPVGHCWECGYNLTGLPEPRCPECGTPFDPDWHGLG